MLQFFRKYQRFFFIIITFVIVISFSFFGTYSALMTGPSPGETPAFTAVDGTVISKGEVDQLVHFISTDADDKQLFGGAWGPNFLNDGVIKNDFLETGLGLMLAKQYSPQLAVDLQPRLEKEKRYVFYSHPQAGFINVENAWGYFAPDLQTQYQQLKKANKGEDPDAINARIHLFLGEKKFPGPAVKQVLRYQERQYPWLAPDQNLDRIDLSLFGYHTAEDWFGSRFIRVISQFILNAAKIAEQKGYVVSKEEALVDLLHNAESSFHQNRNSPYLGVTSAQEYFEEQLRQMGMDQVQAVKIWRQVLLFRRLFHDVGNSAFVTPYEYQKFDGYAQEIVDGDLYQLPKPLRLANYRQLQKFEVYLDAVSKRGDLLSLPTTFFTVAEVEKQTPQLVQKRYLLEVGEVDKKTLQAKVGLKETWDWEGEEKNWKLLQEKFPDLGSKKGGNSEERLASLDSLDEKTRAKVDAIARNAIVDAHPDWLKNALDEANAKKIAVGVRLKGGKSPFVGLENNGELIGLLDSQDPKKIEQLKAFTADKNFYYRIRVIDRDPQPDILTFAEASSDDTLDQLLKKKLEADYLAIRETRPAEFQKADKSWKDLSEVQDLVADHYFEKLLKAIREDDQKASNNLEGAPEVYHGDFYAVHRLYKYVRDIKEKIQKNEAVAKEYVREIPETSASEIAAEDRLPAREKLQDQWKLDGEKYQQSRSAMSFSDGMNPEELFGLQSNEWSKVYPSLKGNILFFQLKNKKNGVDPAEVSMKMEKVQKLLSDEAQRILMGKVLGEIQAKNAIALD